MAAFHCKPLDVGFSKYGGADRITRHLPSHLMLARTQRLRNFACEGLALPRGLHWPVSEIFSRFFNRHAQDSQGELAALEAPEAEQSSLPEQQPPQLPLRALILNSTTSALYAGMRWTGVALRLAKIVVNDMRKTLTKRLRRPSPESQASDLMRNAQAQLLQKAKRQMLEEQGKDAAFMQMLKNLDRCHIDHDEKWALFTKLSADKAEFSKQWQHLYHLAMESKAAVDTLLRPEASRCERNSFWKSAQTSAIIAEEDALKQLVFAQVFQAQKS